jgi:16S rRNA (cytosine1402-N4)-methyltransferase
MHQPVLQKEVIQYLSPKRNEKFIDGTIGEGGHSLEIVKRNGPNGLILGIDRDKAQIERLRKKIEEENVEKRIILVWDNFANLKEIVAKYKFSNVRGILLDLGLSSWHLEESGKGFSFQKEEPLDMRYDPEGTLRAEDILNDWPLKDIEKIIREYGEERHSQRIAKAIIKERKKKRIETTAQLVAIINQAMPGSLRSKARTGKKHWATRTFQALRIAVNDELNNIQKGIRASLSIIEPSGRLVVISFHSLEDRIVKKFFKEKEKEGLIKIETKKPITPSLEEVKKNKRSRSAKLRAATILKI